jgi:hypothetical protein
MSTPKDRYGRPVIRSKSTPEQSVIASITESAADVLKTGLRIESGLVSKNQPIPFNEAHPEALVIQCSDGRYTPIVAELMRSNGI